MQRKQLQKQVKRLTEEKKKLEKVEAGLIKRGLDETAAGCLYGTIYC